MQGGQVGVWMCDIWVSIQGYGIQPGRAVCSVTSAVSDLMWPMDGRLPGSSVHGTLQARILEWVAVLSSRGSSRPRNQTHISGISCIAGGFFTHWVTREACPTRLHVVKGRRAICSCVASQTLNVSWTLPANTQRKKKKKCIFPELCISSISASKSLGHKLLRAAWLRRITEK